MHAHPLPPHDVVRMLPDSRSRRVRLVYYDSHGVDTFERVVPRDCNLADHQVELLREGRAWEAARRRRIVHLEHEV